MRILAVNIGSSRTISIKHRTVQTGIYKTPAIGPVAVTRLGLQDDVRVAPRKMGLEYSAVYAYPYEHYAYWQGVLGRESFPMGQFGENLTVIGLLEEEVRIGDIFRFGSAVMQVAHPRIPCSKLNERMGLHFSSMFLASGKVGYYLRVLEEGMVAAGDTIELLERDEASPTIEEFVRVTQFEYWDAEALQSLLQARDLMPAWREMIEDKLARARAASGWHGLREFEVVHREQESEDTVSLNLKCIRGRALAPFHGGQQLVVARGGRSARQQRRPYFLSSNPHDLSTYRITVRHSPAAEQTVSAYLASLKVGEHILCTAPQGTPVPAPKQADDDRITVLLSQDLGIAPMLSLLYELEGRQEHAYLFHEAAANEPQGLLREARALIARNPGFHMMDATAGAPCHIDTALIRRYVSLEQADLHIAGSSHFVERLADNFTSAGLSPSALIVQGVD